MMFSGNTQRVGDERAPALFHLDRQQLAALERGAVFEVFGEGYEFSSCHSFPPSLFLEGTGLLQSVSVFPAETRAIFSLEGQGSWKDDINLLRRTVERACYEVLKIMAVFFKLSVARDGYVFSLPARGTLRITDLTLPFEGPGELELVLSNWNLEESAPPALRGDGELLHQGRSILSLRGIVARLEPFQKLDQFLARKDVPASVEDIEKFLRMYPQPVESFQNRWGVRTMVSWSLGNLAESWGDMYAGLPPERRCLQVPAPPILTMTRVLNVVGCEPGKAEIGAVSEIEFLPPIDPWYFEGNSSPVVPFSALLEFAVQNPVWLAMYMGLDNHFNESTYTRNLDVKGIIHRNPTRNDRCFRIRTTVAKISKLIGVLIAGFQVEVFSGQDKIISVDTVYGMFTAKGMANQKGFTEWNGDFIDKSSLRPIDFSPSFPGTAPALERNKALMLDRMTPLFSSNLGPRCLYAEKDIRPSDWYFSAHFFRDPVMPGSFGGEAAFQALQNFLRESGLRTQFKKPLCVPMTGSEFTLKYRGQIVPNNKTMGVFLTILEDKTDLNAPEPYITGEASILSDDKCIYKIGTFGLKLVEGEGLVVT